VFEEAGSPASQLPEGLAGLYGGGLALPRPVLYANFVTSLDGVTAVDPRVAGQGGLISGGLAADRFVMGLLRAFADVVLVGAGTLRAEPRHVWSPERVHPPAAAGYAELRRRLDLPAFLPLAVVTGSGELDLNLPGLAGGLVLTSASGADRIGADPPHGIRVMALGTGPTVAAEDAVGALREAGFRSILSEGGPHLFGGLLSARLVDQLFLTLSPVLAGRDRRAAQLGLVEGTSLLPGISIRGRLLSARRCDSHLFLRYDLHSGH